MDTKETSELLRAVSACLIEFFEGIEDGNFGGMDRLKALHLIPAIIMGIKGSGKIIEEIKDLDQYEHQALVGEIQDTLLRSKRLSHRAVDLAGDIFDLAYYNVRQISKMYHRPPTAELVQG